MDNEIGSGENTRGAPTNVVSIDTKQPLTIREVDRESREANRESEEIKKPKYTKYETEGRKNSRRKFLKSFIPGAALVATGVATLLGLGHVANNESTDTTALNEFKSRPTTSETVKNEQANVFLRGRTEIDLKKVNIRTSPEVTHGGEAFDNIIDQSSIRRVEEVDFPKNAETMSTDNAVLVDGNDMNGRWFRFSFELNDGTIEEGYINFDTNKETGGVEVSSEVDLIDSSIPGGELNKVSFPKSTEQ